VRALLEEVGDDWIRHQAAFDEVVLDAD